MQRTAYGVGHGSRVRSALRTGRGTVYAAGAAAALLALLATGCSAGPETEASRADAKPGAGATPAAAPGKYRTLPEPCGSVGRSTLKDLLPGTVELPEEQQEEALRGAAASTFDTDRRVGCSWKAQSPDASHTLSLDFERVVSYDNAVSDNDRAQEVFAKKQTAASLPVTAPGDASSTPQGSASTGPAGEAGDTGDTDAEPEGTPGADAEDLDPRVLDDLGDAAFLNDELASAGSGSTAQRRTVSVVFRTSNVIVTVVHTEQSGRATETPDSKELQEKAQSLAHKLAEEFGD